MSNTESAVLSRLEILRKTGKSAEADRVLASVLSELEKIPANPRIKVKLGSKFDRDFSEEGYDLEEDVEPLEGDVEFDIFPLRNGEPDRKLGQRDAEKILKFLNSEEGREVSKELRRTRHYLVFTGTVWVGFEPLDEFPERHIVCLDWNGECWYLGLTFFSPVWEDNALVLSPLKNP